MDHLPAGDDDAYGNVTLLTRLGIPSITGDEITTATTFYPNTSQTPTPKIHHQPAGSRAELAAA